ncbi:MAG: hypothetical protein JWO31_958 [Phycisphaerales bacterium]|nr:hypothetical protein [Phycisphaerales bacterium]
MSAPATEVDADEASLSQGDQGRLKLFRRYARNLSVYVPQLADRFACPICLGLFAEGDVLGPDPRVDVGHAFPNELGGRTVTLECRRCNGRLNRAADGELIKLHKQWDAGRPDRPGAEPIKGFVDMPAGRVSVHLSSPGGMRFHHKAAHPGAFDQLVKAAIGGRSLRAEFPGVDHGRTSLAVLHAAHLVLFRAFAYAYLLSPAGRFVSGVLDASDRLDDPPFVTAEVYTAVGFDERIVMRCGAARFSSGEQCLFVALPSPNPSALAEFVFLPGLWEEDVAAFGGLCERAVDSWVRATYRTIDGGPAKSLECPEYANALNLRWHGWERHDVDMTKLMYAVRDAVGGSLARKADALAIARRFGLPETYLCAMVAELTKNGFLERVPKRDRPHLVRLTANATFG